MKWRTFLQVLGIVCFTVVALGQLNPISTLIKAGFYPFRFQYGGETTDESEVEYVDPQTQKKLYKYFPVKSEVVIDTWTGKTYGISDFPELMITETDIINKKVVWHAVQSESRVSYDWDKLREKINARVSKQEDVRRDELLKSYLERR